MEKLTWTVPLISTDAVSTEVAVHVRSILVKGVDLQEGIKRQFIGCITQIREIESEGQHITRLARRFRPVGGYNRPFMAGSSLNRDRDGVKHTFTTQRGPGEDDVKRRRAGTSSDNMTSTVPIPVERAPSVFCGSK